MSKRLRAIIRVLQKHRITKHHSPSDMRVVLEELGPTYVKIGQLLSTRPDLIPKEYATEFSKLKENVKPMPFDKVMQIVSNELGDKAQHITIEPEPIGSASIAQVHRATLQDGTQVVLKVMRENIYQTVSQDIALLISAINYVKFIPSLSQGLDLKQMTKEIWAVMEKEMDFTNELQNLQMMREQNKEIAYVHFPLPYPQYSTKNVLTMEYIDGIKLTNRQQLLDNDYDLKEICEKLVENYLSQMLDNGFYHIDPHSGNIIIREGKIVWIDLGMVGTLSKKDIHFYTECIQAVISQDAYELKDLLLTMVKLQNDDIDHIGLYRDVDFLLKKYSTLAVSEMNVGSILNELLAIMRKHKLVLPDNITMLARALVLLQETVSMLDGTVNLLDFFKNHISSKDILKRVANQSMQTAKDVFLSSHKAIMLPIFLAEVLEQTLKGQTQLNLNVRNIDKLAQTKKRNAFIISLSVILSFALLSCIVALCVLWQTTGAVFFKVMLIIMVVMLLILGVIGIAVYIGFVIYNLRK